MCTDGENALVARLLEQDAGVLQAYYVAFEDTSSTSPHALHYALDLTNTVHCAYGALLLHTLLESSPRYPGAFHALPPALGELMVALGGDLATDPESESAQEITEQIQRYLSKEQAASIRRTPLWKMWLAPSLLFRLMTNVVEEPEEEE
jgi:hypothetical protein